MVVFDGIVINVNKILTFGWGFLSNIINTMKTYQQRNATSEKMWNCISYLLFDFYLTVIKCL